MGHRMVDAPHPQALGTAAAHRIRSGDQPRNRFPSGTRELIRPSLDKVRKHLPDFFEKLREDLSKELRGEQEPKADPQAHPLPQVSDEINSPTTSSSLLVAYRTVTETSLSLSIQS
jgi:hypothetical protein